MKKAKKSTVKIKSKAKPAKKTKASPAKRSYNIQKRLEKTQNVSKLVIESLVDLLVARKGGDVAFSDIAKKSKVPLRTIFRLFKDKQALHAAMDEYLVQFIQNTMSELNQHDFLGFSRNVFSTFDKHQDLVMAYLFSPFGQKARDILRKKFNNVLVDQILKERKIKMNESNKAKLALIANMVNSRMWYDMKADFGLSGDKTGESVQWALSALLDQLEKDS